jgi:hypothetical protein
MQGRYRGSHVHHVGDFGEMKGRYRGVMCTTPEPAKSMTPVRMTLSCRVRADDRLRVDSRGSGVDT